MNNYLELNKAEYLNEMEAEWNHKEIDYEYQQYKKQEAQATWEWLMSENFHLLVSEYEDSIPHQNYLHMNG